MIQRSRRHCSIYLQGLLSHIDLDPTPRGREIAASDTYSLRLVEADEPDDEDADSTMIFCAGQQDSAVPIVGPTSTAWHLPCHMAHMQGCLMLHYSSDEI